MGTDTSESVLALIHKRMDMLSAAQRRVARAFLADYPAAGLSSSHTIAVAAQVSTPTVVRFALDLGFDGFGDLQDHLRAESSETRSGLVVRPCDGHERVSICVSHATRMTAYRPRPVMTRRYGSAPASRW